MRWNLCTNDERWPLERAIQELPGSITGSSLCASSSVVRTGRSAEGWSPGSPLVGSEAELSSSGFVMLSPVRRRGAGRIVPGRHIAGTYPKSDDGSGVASACDDLGECSEEDDAGGRGARAKPRCPITVIAVRSFTPTLRDPTPVACSTSATAVNASPGLSLLLTAAITGTPKNSPSIPVGCRVASSGQLTGQA